MGFGSVVSAAMMAKRVVKLVARLRFRERYIEGKKYYVMHGLLRKSEYNLVKDLVSLDEKGRIITKDPERVIAKLLSSNKLKLDYILAIKMIALADKEDVLGLYMVNTTYEQLIINRKPNENAIAAIKKSAFRGNLMDWKVSLGDNKIDVYDETNMKILTSKTKNRFIVIRRVNEFNIDTNKDTGRKYVIISGTPVGNKGSSYSMVWDARDVEGMDERTLIRAFDLAYYADTIAYGLGEVKKTMEEKDDKTASAVRGLVGVMMKYDIIRDKIYKSIVAAVNLEVAGESLGIAGSEFNSEEEAERWIEDEFMQKFREAKKEFEVVMKEMKKQKEMYEEYENKKDFEYIM